MKILEIKQNTGIGKIKLGMDREEVYRILKEKGDKNTNIEWIEDFHIEYQNNKVVFIEIPNSLSDNFIVLFHDADVFKTEAKLLVKHISQYGKYDDTDCELGYSYSFPSLGIGLWRPSIFEYEMMHNKDFINLSEELQLEEMKDVFFESVCVCVADYYTK